MKTRCLFLIVLISFLASSLADEAKSHKLVKRQFTRPGGQRAFPLSRRRQFPPPEELESSEYVNSEDEEEDEGSLPISAFRRRPPQRPPPEEEYSDDYSYSDEPKTTKPARPKPTARTLIFNNRFASRPRFGQQTSSTTTTTTTTKPTVAASRSRFRATPSQSQRFDVVANILNKTPPPRGSARSISSSRTSNVNADKKPAQANSDASIRRKPSFNNRPRTRGRFRARTSTTTTTTTTTTEPPLEEYYYYYEDEEDIEDQPIATTTSTTTTSTTTTTTRKPSLPKRVSIARRPSNSRRQTTKKPVKFDPESQFLPPPDDPNDALPSLSPTKKFTTSTTVATPKDGIPSHLRSKYRPRSDGRFIDFLRDPNRPRELKGFDLTDYPFYIKVPEDIVFDCEDKKDGYYASVPHKCQLFHYCFAGARYDFLCANYTLYDQTTFTCRFANNVNCESSEQYYYRNDDLWKETTTQAPETTTPRRRRTTPKDDDYDDYYDYEDYEEERRRRRRRRPPPGGRKRKSRRKEQRKPREE